MRSSAPRNSILCFGDSLTAGFRCGGDDTKFHPYAIELRKCAREASGRDWERVTVAVEGHCGYSARDMVRTGQLSTVLRSGGGRPTVVVILMGTNDLRAFPPPSAVDVASDLFALASAGAAEVGVRHVVVLTVPPMPKAESRSADLLHRRLALNEVLLEAGASAAGEGVGAGAADAESSVSVNIKVHCIDAAASLDEADASLWDEDGLHLSKKGYDTLGRVAFEGLSRVFGQE